MKKLTIAVLIYLFLSVAAFAGDAFDFSKIVGRYEGTLEYADYKTDERVTLKTWLEIKVDGSNDAAIFSYFYDDFGKSVAEQSRHRIDRRAKKYFVDTDEFAIKELSFAKSAGKIVLLGKQIDNETLEPIRKTFVFDQDSLTFLKETRQPFQFRNQYKLKRIGENEKATVKDAGVDNFINEQMQQFHIPGLSLAIVRDGKIIRAKGYGLANVESRAAATPETVYEIGSVTKQFTATAIMLLVEADKIKLDAPIADYLTDIPAAWKPITVRQLMNQTSGIKDYFSDEPAFLQTARNPAKTAQILQTVQSAPLLFEPGDAYNYSNTNHYLLGLIIEKTSGESYENFLRIKIFEPLGMTATGFGNQPTNRANRAVGYNYDWSKNVLQRADAVDASWSFAAGALKSSVGDLAKWSQALESGKLVNANSKREMWTAGKLNSGVAHRYGFGWYVDKINGHTNLSHGGDIPGFATYFSNYPDDKLTVIITLNQYLYPKQIADKIAQMYLPELIYKQIADREPAFTEFVQKLYANRATGKSDLWLREVFTPELWKWLEVSLRENQEFYQRLGAPQKIELVERIENENGLLTRHRVVYGNNARLIKFVRDRAGKINDWEDYEE